MKKLIQQIRNNLLVTIFLALFLTLTVQMCFFAKITVDAVKQNSSVLSTMTTQMNDIQNITNQLNEIVKEFDIIVDKLDTVVDELENVVENIKNK